MNWSLAYIIVLVRRTYGVIVTLIALGLGYALFFKETMLICPQVAIVDAAGRAQLIDCNKFSNLHQPVAEKILEDMTLAMWKYQKGELKPYARRYQDFKKYLKEYSQAAEVVAGEFTRTVGTDKNGPIMNESSDFSLDKNTFRFQKEEDKWLVYFEGQRTRALVQGNDVKRAKIKAVIVGGDIDAIYKVSSISYSFE